MVNPIFYTSLSHKLPTFYNMQNSTMKHMKKQLIWPKVALLIHALHDSYDDYNNMYPILRFHTLQRSVNS